LLRVGGGFPPNTIPNSGVELFKYIVNQEHSPNQPH
jgi:hypothetical protein